MRRCAPLNSLAVLTSLSVALLAPALLSAAPIASPGGFVGPITALDFDSATHGADASTLYAAQGVTFQHDNGGPIPIFDYTTIAPPRTTTSTPNVVYTIQGVDGSVFSDHLELVFSQPILEVGAFFGNDVGLASFTVQLSVFDGLLLVETTTVSTNNNADVDQFIGISSGTAFDRARITYLSAGGDVSVALDDVMFSTIPEPSTGLLLALGLVGVARRRRS